MSDQEKSNTLIDTVSKLQRNEIIRYASNLGFEIGESLDDSQLQQAYTDWVLANPKELMTRLPISDLKTLKEIRDHKAPEPSNYFNNYLTPMMVKYGLVGMEEISDVHVRYHVPADLMKAVAPILDKWLEDNNNIIRMEVEVLVEGLANIFGYVDQTTIKKYMREFHCVDDEDILQKGLTYIRQFSLLLDSMEWAENLEETPDEEVLFFSRYAIAKAATFKEIIDRGAQGISAPTFDQKSIALASAVTIPEIPNEYGKEFSQYLNKTFKLDPLDIRKICFRLWLHRLPIPDGPSKKQMEVHFLSSVIGMSEHDLSSEEINEALKRMGNYLNAIPLWQLRGHAAWEYPKHIYMRELDITPAMAKDLNRARKESRLLANFLNGESKPSKEDLECLIEMFPQLVPKKQETKKEEKKDPGHSVARVGRNDPCPCGSGLKYKKCHGKNV